MSPDWVTVISREMHVSVMTVFGMRVPVGPKCCGRDTVLFREEPLADDGTGTREHFRCLLCHDVTEVIVREARRQDRAPSGSPFCRHCGHELESRPDQILLLLQAAGN